MHFNDSELVLIYNSNSSRDRKTLAYAMSISPKINKQELNSVRVSSTLFEMVLDSLKLSGKDVINKADPMYQSTYRGRNLTNEEWFSLIKMHPHLLKAPLAMYKGKAVLCNSETDILQIT